MTMESIKSSNGFSYYGDRKGWLIALSQHYNADALTRSNFRIAARSLGIDIDLGLFDPFSGPNGMNDDDTAAIESYGGAAGRGQWLLVKPGSTAETAAEEILERIDRDTFLDEEDYSDLEREEGLEFVSDAIKYRWSNHEWATEEFVAEVAYTFLYNSQYPWLNWPKFNKSRVDRENLAEATWQARKEKKR